MSTIEKGLSWPESMLEDIKSEAARTDRSLSWCVQQAWTIARQELCALTPASSHPTAEKIFLARFAEGDKRKVTLFFPESMLREIESEAKRQDRPESWLVQRAWCLAGAAIAALPTTGS